MHFKIPWKRNFLLAWYLILFSWLTIKWDTMMDPHVITTDMYNPCSTTFLFWTLRQKGEGVIKCLVPIIPKHLIPCSTGAKVSGIMSLEGEERGATLCIFWAVFWRSWYLNECLLWLQSESNINIKTYVKADSVCYTCSKLLVKWLWSLDCFQVKFGYGMCITILSPGNNNCNAHTKVGSK